MNPLIAKLKLIERTINDEKGGFALFALLLRRDAVDRWDLVAAANWIDADRSGAMNYLSEKLTSALDDQDIVRIDRIAPLSVDNPSIQTLQQDLHSHGLRDGHGVAPLVQEDSDLQEIRNIDFSSQDIRMGFVFALNTEGKSVKLPLIPNSAD